MICAPSLLAADFSKLAAEVKRIERAGADWLHLDVMDGMFVPNISFGPAVIKVLRPHSKLYFDTHLMIVEPERYIAQFVDAGSDNITFHVEATSDPTEVIRNIKGAGVDAGISINAGTKADAVLQFLDKVDLVLVMSVKAGFGGQELIPSALEEARKIREFIDKEKLGTKLEMDGGINAKTLQLVAGAGVDVAVAGSYVFRSEDAREAIASIKRAKRTGAKKQRQKGKGAKIKEAK